MYIFRRIMPIFMMALVFTGCAVQKKSLEDWDKNILVLAYSGSVQPPEETAILVSLPFFVFPSGAFQPQDKTGAKYHHGYLNLSVVDGKPVSCLLSCNFRSTKMGIFGAYATYTQILPGQHDLKFFYNDGMKHSTGNPALSVKLKAGDIFMIEPVLKDNKVAPVLINLSNTNDAPIIRKIINQLLQEINND